jgi:MOSC domain-containing protein YiiM
VTGIDKRPVDGRVDVGLLGLDGDRQYDTAHHGGPEQAVYAYAREDLDYWQAMLGRPLRDGLFGENLTVEGIDLRTVPVGQRWRVAPPGAPDNTEALELEVTHLRTPCATFKRWMDEPQWVRRFADEGRLGAYLRVITPGTVGAGDQLTPIHTPTHGVAVSASARGLTREAARALLDSDAAGEIRLSAKLRAIAERTLDALSTA